MLGYYQITFYDNTNPPFVTNDIVQIFYDRDNSVFYVTKNGIQITTGPTLGPASEFSVPPFGTPGFISHYSFPVPIDNDGIPNFLRPDPQFCDGNNLIHFNPSNIFPYAVLITDVDSPSCVNTVCDIFYYGAPIVVKPTEPLSMDGSITVEALSTYAPIRYSLSDIPYASMTNTTGEFTGLVAGSYIVYARDTKGCVAVMAIELKAVFNYYPKYRLEYRDYNNFLTRVDILQLDYDGDVIEIKGGPMPFILRLRGENEGLFNPVLSTEAELQLTSETNFQYIDLFTQNDREYQVRYSKSYNDGDTFTEYWRGFNTTSLYQEQYYTTSNYYVVISITDQLTLLSGIDFTDESGNNLDGDISLIKIIATILAKTDLNLNIRIACDIFENDQDNGVGNTAFSQTYVNVKNTYINSEGEVKDCLFVLSNILLSFGARIFQWEGAWNIVSIYQSNVEYSYVVYDTEGNYVSNSSFNPVIEFKSAELSNRAAWISRSQILEIIPALGKLSIIFNLLKHENGVINGGFDEIIPPTSIPGRLGGYPGWTLILNGNIASYPYINNFFIDIKGNTSDSTFISIDENTIRLKEINYAGVLISNSDNDTYGQDAYLLSADVNIIFTALDAIHFAFDFFWREFGNGTPLPYLKFKWSLKVENYYLQGDGSWSTDINKEWVEVIVSESSTNKWETIDITAFCPPVSGTVTSVYNVRIMHGGWLPSTFGDNCWQIDSFVELKNIVTVALPLGYIVWTFFSEGGLFVLRYYRLDSSTLPESSPDYIRPNDYDGSTNRVVWVMINEIVDGRYTFNFIDKFDNVTVDFLPEGIDPPDSKEYTQLNNPNFKETLEVEVNNGDAPIDINNSVNIYKNFYKLSDGTPTDFWARNGFPESRQLLALLSGQYMEQYSEARFKLTGEFKTDLFFGFNVCLKDGDRYFIPTGMELKDLRNEYSVELHEVKVVDGSTGNPFENGEFVSNEFGQDYDI